MAARTAELKGMHFGRLRVIGRAPDKGKSVRWDCLCDCGEMCTPHAASLRNGSSTSCGCLMRELVGPRLREVNTTHGRSRTAEYKIWGGIMRRCYNEGNTSYPLYGGRGITVCDRWKTFDTFFEDMGPRPSRHHSIDRIDNNGPYSPENCRWATKRQQDRNKSTNRLVVYRGREMCFVEAYEMSDRVVPYQTARTRLRCGWPADLAVDTPARWRRRRAG